MDRFTKEEMMLKNEKPTNKGEEIDKQIESIQEFGTNNLPKASKGIHTISIIGQIEGHMVAPPQSKSTKYEHIILN